MLVGPRHQHGIAQPQADLLQQEPGQHRPETGRGRGDDEHRRSPQGGRCEHDLALEAAEQSRNEGAARQAGHVDERQDPSHRPEPSAHQGLKPRLPEDVEREPGEGRGEGQRTEEPQDGGSPHRRDAGERRAAERSSAPCLVRGRPRLVHEESSRDRGQREHPGAYEPGHGPSELGDVAAGHAAHDHDGPEDDLRTREEPVGRTRVAVRPHTVDHPGVEGTTGERRADGVDELRHETVGEAVRAGVEAVRPHPDDAAREEGRLSAEAVRDRAGGNLEDEHRDQVGRQDGVHLEEIESAAEEEERIDGRDEELRQGVAAEDHIVCPLGARHRETMIHNGPGCRLKRATSTVVGTGRTTA